MKKEYFVLVPFLTLIICQLIKFINESLKNHKLMWGRLFNGSGGMPSSHSSFCFSLTTLVGIEEGMGPLFGICLVFSFVIAYDAMGLRQESGKHAIEINQLFDEVFKDRKQIRKRLKEQLGHKPLEVLVGILLGVSMGTLFGYFL